MTTKRGDKIDDVANEVDELKTSVEELAEDPSLADSPALEQLKTAVNDARRQAPRASQMAL